jgi:DNA-directed RNA polymerase specialized sigma24 family protein
MADQLTVARETREMKRLVLEENMSIRQIAAKYDLNENTVMYRLARIGVRSVGQHQREEMRKRVVLLRLDGLTLKEIARRVGTSFGCVQRHLNAHRKQVAEQLITQQKMAAD